MSTKIHTEAVELLDRLNRHYLPELHALKNGKLNYDEAT